MDKLSLVLRYGAAAALILILSFFTYIKMVSPDVLVAVVTAAFGGLGVHVAGRYSGGADTGKSLGGSGQGGFMRFSLLLPLAAFAAVFLLAGCATTSTTSDDTTTTTDTTTTVATPDTTEMCADTQNVLTLLSTAFTTLDSSTSQTLSDAATVVADICTAGVTLDATSLTTLASTTLPDLATLVSNSSLDSATKLTIKTAIVAAEVAVALVNSQLETDSWTPNKTKALLHEANEKAKEFLKANQAILDSLPAAKASYLRLQGKH